MPKRPTPDQTIMLDHIRAGHHPRDFTADRRRVTGIEVGTEGPDLLVSLSVDHGGNELWRIGPDGAARAV